ncbi:MAG: hypothetical protein ACPH5P_03535 [Akkermansiaceae bacterium]
MKKYFIPWLLATLLVFVSCGKKEAEVPSENELPVTEEVVEPAITPEQRASVLGFAQYLPKDISHYSAVINASSSIERFCQSPLGVLIMDRMEDEGISVDDLDMLMGVDYNLSGLSNDFFVAYGAGAPAAVDSFTTFLGRLCYNAGRIGVYAGNALVKDSSDGAMHPTMLFGSPMKGIAPDFIKFLEEFDMPAYYQGIHVSDDEGRAMAREELEALPMLMSMMEIAVEPITIDRAGSSFEGWKFSGAEFVAVIKEQFLNEGGARSLSESMGVSKDDIKAFLEAMASKNLIAVVGEIDEYVVLFVGNSEEDLVIIEDVNESLCASDQIEFIDSYLDKDLFSFGVSNGSMASSSAALEKMFYGLFGSLAQGLSDGLEEADALGDTQDIEVMLDALHQKAKGILAMYEESNAGYVAFIEDGIKFEMHGGSNMPHLDMDTEHTLTPMSQGERNLLFLNWVSDPEYNENVMQFIDILSQTSYSLTRHLLPILEKADGNGEFAAFNAGMQMFDQMFRDDLLEIWRALRTNMAEGLGAETAVVVDLNGAMPKAPMLPEPIIENGKMPRIAYVSTVDDRDKLKQSWQRLNKSIDSLLRKAGELAGGMEIPMQAPMSSEKNGLTTWFVPVPFQNDDFVPSVSVSDELFFASTSKQFAEGLSAQAGKDASGQRSGMWLEIDLKVSHQYAQDWLELVEDNADDLMSAPEADDFRANKEMLEAALEALGSLDKFIYHVRKEDGQTRTSLHLKSK